MLLRTRYNHFLVFNNLKTYCVIFLLKDLLFMPWEWSLPCFFYADRPAKPEQRQKSRGCRRNWLEFICTGNIRKHLEPSVCCENMTNFSSLNYETTKYGSISLWKFSCSFTNTFLCFLFNLDCSRLLNDCFMLINACTFPLALLLVFFHQY